MKKVFLLVAAASVCFSLSAQTKKSVEGTLSTKDLSEIRSSFVKNSETKALQNVISNNSNIKALSLNREIQGDVDHYFKYRVNVSGITDQHSSGRCWMFTSMNAKRPAVMSKYDIAAFDFSHNYNYFWDIFEKSNLFLEAVIDSANEPMTSRQVTHLFVNMVGDGGVWNNYYNVAEKYGVVPKTVMPETAHSDNTGQINRLINERLRKGGFELRELSAKKGAKKAKAKAIKAEKVDIMKDVYRILALTLGEPPVNFTWRYKTKAGEIKELNNYTPQQFYAEIKPADYNPESQIMIMNDPTRPYYKVYEIDLYRNTQEGVNWRYLNLPNVDIKKAMLASIKNNEPMYASCDVGKQANYKAGVNAMNMYDYSTLFGIDFDMDKKTRILTRQSGSAHAMLVIGCDTDENDKPIKWEFENSWGKGSGNNGYLTFTDEWFDEYMFRMIVGKKYLDLKALEALKSKPEMLPVWDYMF